MKRCNISASFSLMLLFTFTLSFTADCQNQEIKLQKVTNQLYAIAPFYGNKGILVTEEGVVMVDIGFNPAQAAKIESIIQEITDKPIKYLILTHYHGDHTTGAQSFPSSIKIISHENTRKNLENFYLSQLENWINKAFPEYISKLEQNVEKLKAEKSGELEKAEKQLKEAHQEFENVKQSKFAIPEITYEKEHEIQIGHQTVQLLYMGSAHTNGDTLVYLPKEKVILMGDVFYNNMIPYIDYRAGSDTENWIKILEQVAKMDIEKVIPGHGEITDKKALLAQAQYLKDLRAEVAKYIEQGISLEDTKEKAKLPKYKNMERYDSNFLDNVEAVYKEMTDKKKAEQH